MKVLVISFSDIMKNRCTVCTPTLNDQNYSWSGAPTGQTLAQAPHSMQESASITYIPSPADMQLTGHSASQAPQEIQVSAIL